MVLKHKRKICLLNNSILLDANIVRRVIRNLTPPVIYSQNKEFFNAFADTLTNYAPVSINIVDYWNKSADKSSIYATEIDDKLLQYEDWAFKFEDGIDDSGKIYRNGFNEGPFSLNEEVHNVNSDSLCEKNNGFYINSLIGLQDKLAYTFMNNVYVVSERVKHDWKLRAKLEELMKKSGYGNLINKTEFFENINDLFTENAFLSQREFNLRKGQQRSLYYTFKKADEAKIQGEALRRPFYYHYESPAPFEYKVESSLIPDIFESFIKPLAHPIGFVYDFLSVCSNEFEETPFIDIKNRATRVYVYEICMSVDEDYNRVSPGDDTNPPQPRVGEGNEETILCPIDTENVSNYDYEYTIGTSDGTGLWDAIPSDEGTGNILEKIENGIIYSGYFKNYPFKKYIFENGNYLIEYINPDNGNKTIEYYRLGDVLVSRWIDKRHVSVVLENPVTETTSPVDESFEASCIALPPSEPFGFLGDGNGPYGFDEGHWTRL